MALGLRSGGPANHEHADRNSIILNAHGERFFHDPLGAAYSNKDQHWLLRLTEAHTAVLIDGKGHQYHDGSEGTNSSKAVAKITQYEPGKNFTVISSDATPAYKMVNDDIKKIQRTIALVKPDVLIIIDEMEKEKIKSMFQARFQVFNTDGKAIIMPYRNKQSFWIYRPYATLVSKIFSSVNFDMVQSNLDIQPENGVFPFIEVSNEPAKKCTMITVCSMFPINEKQNPEIIIDPVHENYEIQIKLSEREISLDVEMRPDYPVVKLNI
jgi:hypothetical protein